MRRSKKTTVLSAVLAGTAITMFIIFLVAGGIIPLVAAFLLLFASGYARRRVTYDEYRDRYEEQFGMDESDSPEQDDPSA